MSWNLGGWTVGNSIFREAVITGLKCDIVVVQETHLKHDNIISVPGYLCDKTFFNNRKVTHNRAKKGYGGVAILFHNDFLKDFDIELIDKTIDGLIVVKVTKKESSYKFMLAGCYLPPEQSVWGRDAEGFYAHILHLIYQYSDVDAFYVCGDLNSRIGKKIDYIENIDNISGRNVIDFVQNSHGAALHDFLVDARFCIVNGRVTPEYNNFTFIHPRGRSVVDFFLTSIDGIASCKHFEVLPPGVALERYYRSDVRAPESVSDHSVLKLTIALVLNDNDEHMVEDFETCQWKSPIPKDDIFFKRFKMETLPENFLNSPETNAALLQMIADVERVRVDQESIDLIYKRFCNIYHSELQTYFKSTDIYPSAKKRYFRNSKPYWNDQLRNMWADVRKTEVEFTRARGPNVSHARQKFKEAQNKFDKLYRREKRKYQRTQFNDLENAISNDPKAFWKILKSLGPQKKLSIPMEVYDEQNNVNTDINYVTNKWKSEFQKLFSCSTGETVSQFDDAFYRECCDSLNEMESNGPSLPGLNHEITEQEVRKAIGNCKARKAVGIDNLPNEIFKNEISIEVFTLLFKKIFECKVFPSIWAKSVLKPIPKSSTIDPRVPLEYRGISLLSTVYKLYSSILNSRLTNCAELHGLLAEEQNGFRKARSCEDHCFALSSVVRNQKALNRSTFVGLIDLKKAFDCVDRKLLLFKLLKAGINGNLFQNIKNIYSNCETAINVNGYISDFFPCNSGVRQGDCLSSTLFLFFINDLIEDIRNQTNGIKNEFFELHCLMYADDLALIAENEEDLQNMLNVLSNWCRKWRMSVNTSKSAVIHFRNSRTARTQFQFEYNSQAIKVVDKYKYLGMVFNEFLDYKISSKVLADSGGRALGALYSKFKHNNGLGFDTFTKLYECGVAPILDYGSAIWGFGEHESINSVHNRAIRMFLGVHRFAPISAIIGDMGWVPSKIRRYVNMFRFWNRLTMMNDNRLTKKIFQWDKSFSHTNWSFEISQLFNSVSLNNVFDSENYVDIEEVRNKLLEHHKTQWCIRAQSFPKLRTYTRYKNEFCTEPFVKLIHNRNYRSILAQFRSGILPLAVETGRFNNIPVEYRLCRYCNENEIEDEIHFLLNCSAYNEFRFNMTNKAANINTNFWNLPINIKIKLLMSSSVIRETTTFLYNAYQKRKQLTFQ